MATEFKTIGELRKAIKKANIVHIQARFGVTEKWLTITKVEARYLLNGYRDEATAKELGMGTDVVGTGDGFNKGDFGDIVVWIGG